MNCSYIGVTHILERSKLGIYVLGKHAVSRNEHFALDMVLVIQETLDKGIIMTLRFRSKI